MQTQRGIFQFIWENGDLDHQKHANVKKVFCHFCQQIFASSNLPWQNDSLLLFSFIM